MDGLKSIVAQMVASSSYEVRPTAIYANPVLLDLIDREMKTRLQRGAVDRLKVAAGLRVKMLFDAGWRSAVDPRRGLSYTGTPGLGHSKFCRAYIVTRGLIEYHWLGDTDAAHLPTGSHRSLASPGLVAVKFGGLVVKGASLCALRSESQPVGQFSVLGSQIWETHALSLHRTEGPGRAPKGLRTETFLESNKEGTGNES